jgi:hypothetical protein
MTASVGDPDPHGHVWYKRPNGKPLVLHRTPLLASWDDSTSASQIELKAYLADIEHRLATEVQALRQPWSLRLDIGLPSDRDLLNAADLDNFGYPLARQLTREDGPAAAPLVSAWCTKSKAARSLVRVEPATPAPPPSGTPHRIRTTAGVSTEAFKRQVRDAVATASVVPGGAVRMQISYVVGQRNWLNLWKPTIDALDPLLGRTDPREWHPRDGRIVDLGLHVHQDPQLVYNVRMCIHCEAIT